MLGGERAKLRRVTLCRAVELCFHLPVCSEECIARLSLFWFRLFHFRCPFLRSWLRQLFCSTPQPTPLCIILPFLPSLSCTFCTLDPDGTRVSLICLWTVTVLTGMIVDITHSYTPKTRTRCKSCHYRLRNYASLHTVQTCKKPLITSWSSHAS